MRQKNSAKLMFFCGKMAAGKSSLARDLAVRENAVLLVQDDFLNACFLAISKTSGFRGPLYAMEERADATHLRSCQIGFLSCSILRPPRRHSGMVSRADRAHTHVE